jgi:hypothetical protein
MIQIELYFDNVWKQRLWQKIVPKTDVEQTESSGRSYPYLYPIGNLAQGSLIEAPMCAPTKEAFWKAF